MHIVFNDREIQISSDSSLENLLEQHHLKEGKGIAVAVNEQVIPRTRWSEQKLKNNDRVLVIQATQGG